MKKLLTLVLALCLMAAFPLAGLAEMANMINPWTDCTAEEAFDYFGLKFEITAPEGFENPEYAYLNIDAFPDVYTSEDRSLRVVYTKGEEMFRVHLYCMEESIAVGDEEGEKEFVALQKGDAKGFYGMAEKALYVEWSGLVENRTVTASIDSSLITEDSAPDFLDCVRIEK